MSDFGFYFSYFIACCCFFSSSACIKQGGAETEMKYKLNKCVSCLETSPLSLIIHKTLAAYEQNLNLIQPHVLISMRKCLITPAALNVKSPHYKCGFNFEGDDVDTGDASADSGENSR